MSIRISNQKKCRLEPFYNDDVTKPLNTETLYVNAAAIMEQIYNPIDQSKDVIIENENGYRIEKEELVQLLLSSCKLIYKKNVENIMTDVWNQSLNNYKEGLAASQVFISQANKSINAPQPSSTVLYVPQDLKEACKKYIKTHNENELVVNASFYINEACAMFYFQDKAEFDEYKAYIKNLVGTFAAKLDANVVNKFNDFNKISLKIIEGVLLRKNVTDGLEPYSFERMVMKFSLMYMQHKREIAIQTGQHEKCGIIIPYIDELFLPKNLIFLNVENIAKAPNGKLAREVNNIKTGMKEWFTAISFNKIIKLSEAAAQKRIIGYKLKNHSDLMNQSREKLEKRSIFRFKKVAMTKYDLSKLIVKIIKKEVNISVSENYSKVVKTSYMRSNRRNPDNFNLPGKSYSLIYKPDIHLYLDTSGSISEENYKNAILTCITMAKKLNVNIYFNSFSHRISQCCKLHVKDKTIQGIYKEFQKIPKVTGGTSYDIVWDYIMRSIKRQKEISIIITDFAYEPPTKRPDYPSRIYYAPIDVSKASWPYVSQYAKEFCQNMYHIDPNIRKHILMN